MHLTLSVFPVVVALAAVGCGAGSVPTAVPGPTVVATPARTAMAPAIGVTIYHVTQSQFELSAGGPRILIDVVSPSRLSKPASIDEVLLIKHGDPDHFDPGFFKAFKGRKVLMKPDHFMVGPITVTSIPAAHNEGDPITADGATDFIYIVDIAGMRVVHFGDLGQDRLTADQLAALGHVDVAISQLNNPFGEVDEVNQRGFRQMAQVQPRLLIPTHMFGSVPTAQLAATTWPTFSTTKPSIVLTQDRLPSATTALFMADNAELFGSRLALPAGDW
jgi:hypothetical protein